MLCPHQKNKVDGGLELFGWRIIGIKTKARNKKQAQQKSAVVEGGKADCNKTKRQRTKEGKERNIVF